MSLKVPERIFRSNHWKRTMVAIFPGREEWSNEKQKYMRIGRINMYVGEDGLVKTNDPTIIDAIEGEYKKYFVKPKFKVNQDGLRNEFAGWSDELNEVYLDDNHKKAVLKAIENGDYDYIPEEDIEMELKKAQKEKMKLDLIDLKNENEARKKELKSKTKKTKKD